MNYKKTFFIISLCLIGYYFYSPTNEVKTTNQEVGAGKVKPKIKRIAKAVDLFKSFEDKLGVEYMHTEDKIFVSNLDGASSEGFSSFEFHFKDFSELSGKIIFTINIQGNEFEDELDVVGGIAMHQEENTIFSMRIFKDEGGVLPTLRLIYEVSKDGTVLDNNTYYLHDKKNIQSITASVESAVINFEHEMHEREDASYGQEACDESGDCQMTAEEIQIANVRDMEMQQASMENEGYNFSDEPSSEELNDYTGRRWDAHLELANESWDAANSN